MDRLLMSWRAAAAALVLFAASSASYPAQAAGSGDPAHGRQVFAAQCSMCHSPARDGPRLMGPSLFGVVGRKAGVLQGYAYSPAMRAQGFVWTNERLRAYLPAPGRMVPGTRMAMYPGLNNSRQVDDVIAYLDTLK